MKPRDTVARPAQTQASVVRRYCETRYGARFWRCERRVAARIEATTQGSDIRYVVTNIAAGSPSAVAGAARHT
jgi:hypothetical protein